MLVTNSDLQMVFYKQPSPVPLRIQLMRIWTQLRIGTQKADIPSKIWQRLLMILNIIFT